MLVDVRYVILGLILVGTVFLIKKHPTWEKAALVGLAAATLTYAVMFDISLG